MPRRRLKGTRQALCSTGLSYALIRAKQHLAMASAFRKDGRENELATSNFSSSASISESQRDQRHSVASHHISASKPRNRATFTKEARR